MIINFRKLFEFLFKSFDISSDTKLIEKYEKDGLRFLMVIKRHWIYGILHSWRVLAVFIIAIANSYLLLFSGEHIVWGTILSIFLVGNVFYWTIIIIIYLLEYHRINGKEAHIEDIYTAIRQNKESDTAFSKFFNQTIFLLLSLVVIVVFSILTVVTSIIGESIEQASYGILNIFLLLAQVGLFYSYLAKMINTEMDFKIVVPGQIIFYNQRGVLGSTQTMNANKIKTMNTKYSGLFGSFFNYGDIIILTEGSDTAVGEMIMDFTGNPTKIVKEIKKVLDKDFDLMEKEVNLLLKKFENTIGIKDINSPENIERLRVFVKNNEEMLRELYQKSDEETKREMKELYVILAHN